jgi:hypothetical protein
MGIAGIFVSRYIAIRHHRIAIRITIYREEWNSLFAYFMVGYWLILLMEMVRD